MNSSACYRNGTQNGDGVGQCEHTIIFTLPGASEAIKCPLGYKEYDGSERHTFATTCEPCRPGYYGNHPQRAECRPCRPGVVCQEAATTDVPLANDTLHGVNYTNSYICPAGKHCAL